MITAREAKELADSLTERKAWNTLERISAAIESEADKGCHRYYAYNCDEMILIKKAGSKIEKDKNQYNELQTFVLDRLIRMGYNVEYKFVSSMQGFDPDHLTDVYNRYLLVVSWE